MRAGKTSLRVVSTFVLTCFVASLTSPAFASGSAATASKSAAVADSMAIAGQRALSDLWFVWSSHLKGFQGQATPNYASQFLKSQGASSAQVEVLVNNAAAKGHFQQSLPTAAQAGAGWFDKIKALFKRKGTAVATSSTEAAAKAKGTAEAAAQAKTASSGASGLTARVKSFFARFTGGSSSAAATAKSGYPTAQSMFAKGSVQPAAAVPAASAGGSTAAASSSASASAGDGGVLSGVAAKIKAGAAKVSAAAKGAADKVALGARRGAHGVGSTVQTGYLTAKYAIDPRPYYEIPVHGDTVLKVRGSHSSTVAFKEGRWTTKDFSYKSTWPTRGDLAGKVDGMAAQSQPQGFFGKIVGKFKGLVGKVQTRMRGEANITPETRAEIQRLEVSNHLIDQARTISDAQRALRVRIDQMQHTSSSLRRPVDVEKVKAMEQQIRSLEKTKQDLLKKAGGTMDSPAKTVIKDAAKWALYSVGITASINLIRQAVSGDGINIGEAFAFMTQPSFWAGTAGGFVGATVLGAVANALIPGAGIFMKVIPGFLGAAFGFEIGASFFGGQMDILGTLVTTLASAGGYSLAWMFLGGAAAPGIALIGAAIAAGSLAGFLLDKFRGGGPEAEGYVLPESPLAEAVTEQAPMAEVAQPAASMSPAASANLAAAQKQVEQAYNAYINYLKQRKIPEATTAHQAYMDAQKALELAKANAAAGK